MSDHEINNIQYLKLSMFEMDYVGCVMGHAELRELLTQIG
jgi:hypothetical protein